MTKDPSLLVSFGYTWIVNFRNLLPSSDFIVLIAGDGDPLDAGLSSILTLSY